MLHNYSSYDEKPTQYRLVQLMLQQLFFAKACSVALANFYAKLSRLPDHRIPDDRSSTGLTGIP
jgi:hypothetical protein